MNPAPTVSVGAGTSATDPPNPNHPEPSLRTLPFSSIKVYKNGELLGTVRTSPYSFCVVDFRLVYGKSYCSGRIVQTFLLISETCPTTYLQSN